MISVIIPNFNGASLLPSLFDNLKNVFPLNTEIIFIDNGSTDQSLNILSGLKIPNLILIRNQTNLGFAYAVNQGIVAASNHYVCLLNNDIILKTDWFDFISKEIKKHSEYACFCGTVLDRHGLRIESQGIEFKYSGKCLQLNHSSRFPQKSISNLKPYPVWGSSAAVVVYQKDLILKIGLFDEKYFAYLEDVDVAYRLHHHGCKTLFVPAAIAYHRGGATADQIKGFRAKQTFKNWFYFIFKNYTLSEIILHFPAIFIERLRNLSFLLKSI